jgi:hypothetical protein
MKLAEKTVDSATCLRMKSGVKVNLHVITQDDGSRSLVIEKDDHKLVFQQDEISEFVALFGDFITSI